MTAPADRNEAIARPAPSLISSCQNGASVVLFAPQDSFDLDQTVHLSDGTCQAQGVDPQAPQYVPHARAPVPRWRTPTQEENSVLWSAGAPEAHRGVGLVRLLGPPLVRLFAEQKDALGHFDDADTLKHPLIPLLLDAIRKAGVIAHSVYSARIGRDHPGLVTMTRAVDQDARIGLHFDRWDGLAIDDLASASNRVSINLGPSDRYFVFLNQTASGLASLLEGANLQAARDVRDIGAAFMLAFPTYPIVRLRLRPGEAYIAPTENILHDGTSAEVVETNHYLSMRGRFGFLNT
jgi:hypothetical protein